MIAKTNLLPEIMTPLEFFTEIYEPAHAAEHTPGAMRNYSKAIRSFTRFVGAESPIAELDMAKVCEFDDWLLAEVCQQTATDYGGKVRRVLAEAMPGRFRTRPAGRPKIEGEGGDGTLMQFLHEVYVPRRVNLGTEGAKQYVYTVRWLDRYLGRPVMTDELTDDLVLLFLASLRPQKSVRTINTMRGNLLTLWLHAHKRKLCPTKPEDVQKLREPKRLPECWTPVEIGRLMRCCRESKGELCGIPFSEMLLATVHLGYFTGLRIGAILKIGIGDVDFDNGTLFVPAENQKHFADQRFNLPADTLALLKSLIGYNRKRALLLPVTKKMIYPRFALVVKRAGFRGGRRNMFHKLRRTFGTYLAAAVGINEASRFLGHSGIDVTKRYVDVSKLPSINAAEMLPKVTEGGAS